MIKKCERVTEKESIELDRNKYHNRHSNSTSDIFSRGKMQCISTKNHQQFSNTQSIQKQTADCLENIQNMDGYAHNRKTLNGPTEMGREGAPDMNPVNQDAHKHSSRNRSSSKNPKNGLAIIADHFSAFKSKGFSFGRRSTDTNIKKPEDVQQKILVESLTQPRYQGMGQAGTMNSKNNETQGSRRSSQNPGSNNVDLQHAADFYNLNRKISD